jgi:hypothetical protein
MIERLSNSPLGDKARIQGDRSSRPELETFLALQERLYVVLDTRIGDGVALAFLSSCGITPAGVGTVDGNVDASTAANNSKARPACCRRGRLWQRGQMASIRIGCSRREWCWRRRASSRRSPRIPEAPHSCSSVWKHFARQRAWPRIPFRHPTPGPLRELDSHMDAPSHD